MLSLGMSGYLGMDLPRFLALVRARKWLIAGIVVAATVLAFAVSLAQPSRYRADADLLFGQTTNANAIISGGAADTTDTPEREAATNVALASLDTVAVNVKRRFPGPATVDDLRKAVSIHAQGASDVVTVTAAWDSPSQAAAIANAFATEIVAFRRQAAQTDIQRGIDAVKAQIAALPSTATAGIADLQARVSTLQALKAAQTGNVRLVERAGPPKSRSSPRPLRNAVIAGVLAAIVALFVVVLLARFEDRISDEDELAELMGAPVLTRVPGVGRARRLTHIWGPDQDPGFLEAFEFLRLNLQLMGHRGGLVIAVTSPAAADGKSTVVAWLSRSLALSGDEVVAVDLDLRKPELHAYLNTTREPGAGVLDALLATDPADHGGNGPLPVDEDQGRAPEPEEAAVDTGEPPARGRRVYTDDDVTAGLVEVARCAGNARRAARSLKREGRDISESTLRRWKELHAEHYAEIRSARIRGTSVAPHLRLLAGDHHLLPSGLLARGRLRQLFDQLGEDSDYVLVDTVPVSTVADASVVAAAADAAILVVDLERVRRRDLASAKKQLTNARANLLGIVVNRASVDFPLYHVPEEALLLERDPAG
jgi:Mrp family chromosome partitioning ATPase/capsular polysaccharide biosynthesis protein